MGETNFLKLKTYNESDNPSFIEYRLSLNGDENSNMTKIEDFAVATNEALGQKADMTALEDYVKTTDTIDGGTF